MSRSQHLDYHLSRLLLLLRHAGPYRGSPLVGLTKLAKLDFLLRYPVFLDRVLQRRAIAWSDEAAPTPDELQAVESRMTRYKYGPWDDRYYPLVGALIGLGLVEPPAAKGATRLRLTERGQELANELASSPDWHVVDSRAALLARHFDWTGNRLKTLIYEELPDAVNRPHRVKI